MRICRITSILAFLYTIKYQPQGNMNRIKPTNPQNPTFITHIQLYISNLRC